MNRLRVIRKNKPGGTELMFVGHSPDSNICAAISAYALMLGKMLVNNGLKCDLKAYSRGFVKMDLPNDCSGVVNAVCDAVRAISEQNPDCIEFTET